MTIMIAMMLLRLTVIITPMPALSAPAPTAAALPNQQPNHTHRPTTTTTSYHPDLVLFLILISSDTYPRTTATSYHPESGPTIVDPRSVLPSSATNYHHPNLLVLPSPARLNHPPSPLLTHPGPPTQPSHTYHPTRPSTFTTSPWATSTITSLPTTTTNSPPPPIPPQPPPSYAFHSDFFLQNLKQNPAPFIAY